MKSKIIFALMVLYGGFGLIQAFLISPTILDKLNFDGLTPYMIGNFSGLIIQTILFCYGLYKLVRSLKKPVDKQV